MSERRKKEGYETKVMTPDGKKLSREELAAKTLDEHREKRAGGFGANRYDAPRAEDATTETATIESMASAEEVAGAGE